MKKLLCLPLAFFLFTALLNGQVKENRIRLNQIGFYPNGPKIAVVINSTSNDFSVVSVPSGAVVLNSKLSAPRKSPYSDKTTRIADFSKLTKPGKYALKVSGAGESYTFEIKDGVMNDLTKALIKSYYYQRMSTPILTKYAGKWSREEGHPDTVVLIHPAAASPSRPAESIISCPRGWYDAGDYNKYIVNSGITMGTLLSFYEDYPELSVNLDLNIPESGNGAPDVINEILWNLRWMFTMQDPADGGVYNKVTNPDFDAMVMPALCKNPRYVVPKGTAATLDFAAVMAQATRVFKKFGSVFPGLSDSCLTAAEKAWKWASENQNVPYNQYAMNQKFKPVINTGGYGDNKFGDEFIWAASELYATTWQDKYYSAVNIIPDTLMTLPSWSDVKLLGYYTLGRFNARLTGKPADDFSIIRSGIIREADRLVNGAATGSYMASIGMAASDFVWGSNSVAANEGILLMQAYRLTGDNKYLNNALHNLDYLLGRNATGYSFVTGFGKKAPMFPHHRLSEADGIADPIPGLLVGGPNPGQQDGCKTYPSRIPDESYTDVLCSYASNEIAINWNAPAVYLAGAMEAFFNRKSK